jgi:hypothetical protein
MIKRIWLTEKEYKRLPEFHEHVIVNVVACDQCGDELNAYDLNRDEVFEMIKDNKWITTIEDWTGKHCHYCSVECKELHLSLKSCPRCKSDAMIKVLSDVRLESCARCGSNDVQAVKMSWYNLTKVKPEHHYSVECLKCEAFTDFSENKYKVIKEWNDYAKQEKEK